MFSKILQNKNEIDMTFIPDVIADPEGIASTTKITKEKIYLSTVDMNGLLELWSR